VELIRVGEALESKPAVARHHDLWPDDAMFSSQAAVLYDSPGAGRADPGPGQEHLRHTRADGLRNAMTEIFAELPPDQARQLKRIPADGSVLES
jgi:hypothetical protein